MGLFDRFLEKPATPAAAAYVPSSDHEAWIGILYACMTADGTVGGSEIDALARMLVFKLKFAGIEFKPLYQNVLNAKAAIGGLGLVQACSKFINETDKDTLFAMAVEIVLADGKLDKDEELIIEAVANELHINRELADKIIEVMLIRNRGNKLM